MAWESFVKVLEFVSEKKEIETEIVFVHETEIENVATSVVFVHETEIENAATSVEFVNVNESGTGSWNENVDGYDYVYCYENWSCCWTSSTSSTKEHDY